MIIKIGFNVNEDIDLTENNIEEVHQNIQYRVIIKNSSDFKNLYFRK